MVMVAPLRLGTGSGGTESLAGGGIGAHRDLLNADCAWGALEALGQRIGAAPIGGKSLHAGQVDEKVGQAFECQYRHLVRTERSRHQDVLLRIGSGNRPRRSGGPDLPFRGSRRTESRQTALAALVQQ